MTKPNRKIAIDNELERMEESLRAAKALLDQNLYRDSISRAYYAVYHAACAVLFTKGLEAKSHGGIRSYFSLYFVKTGELDRKYQRLFSKMQKFREEADYESEMVFGEKDGQEIFEEASSFCGDMKKFIKTQIKGR